MPMCTPQTLARFNAVILRNITALKSNTAQYRRPLLHFVHGGQGIVGTPPPAGTG